MRPRPASRFSCSSRIVPALPPASKSAILSMSTTPPRSGIFNVGTGQARSFRDLMTAMFAALGREPAIDYIDMPAALRDSYQYFTQAETANLRRAGYNADFTPLEAAVKSYVTCYL